MVRLKCNVISFSQICGLVGYKQVLTPSLPRATIVAKLDIPLYLFIVTGNPRGIPGNSMKSKEYAPLY